MSLKNYFQYHLKLHLNDVDNNSSKVSCFKQQEVSALHVASRRGHHETVLSLVEECGANVDIRDTNSNTPLHCCFLAPHEPTLDPRFVRNNNEKTFCLV